MGRADDVCLWQLPKLIPSSLLQPLEINMVPDGVFTDEKSRLSLDFLSSIVLSMPIDKHLL